MVQTRDWSGAHPYRKVVAIEKGAFGSPPTTVDNLLTLVVASIFQFIEIDLTY